jgi:hypothetical protein
MGRPSGDGETFRPFPKRGKGYEKRDSLSRSLMDYAYFCLIHPVDAQDICSSDSTVLDGAGGLV